MTINGVKYVNVEAQKPVSEITTAPALPSNQASGGLTTQISIPNANTYNPQGSMPTGAQGGQMIQLNMKKSATDEHQAYTGSFDIS